MIYLVHGIAENGDLSVGRFARRLNAYCHMYRYPTPSIAWINALLVRIPWWRRRLASDLAKRVKRLDHDPCAIAYSNGALVLWEAMRMGAQFEVVVLFGAAFDADRQWPQRFKLLYNVYNKRDRAVRLAAKLWAHLWGDLGARGYSGPPDERIRNISANLKRGHRYFEEPEFTSWVRSVAQWFNVSIVPRAD